MKVIPLYEKLNSSTQLAIWSAAIHGRKLAYKMNTEIYKYLEK